MEIVSKLDLKHLRYAHEIYTLRGDEYDPYKTWAQQHTLHLGFSIVAIEINEGICHRAWLLRSHVEGIETPGDVVVTHRPDPPKLFTVAASSIQPGVKSKLFNPNANWEVHAALLAMPPERHFSRWERFGARTIVIRMPWWRRASRAVVRAFKRLRGWVRSFWRSK